MQRAIIFFAESHPAARRADDGELRLKPRRLRERFTHGRDHHLRRAMQPTLLAPISSELMQTVVGDLRRSLATALLDRESFHRRDAIAPEPKRLRRFCQAEAERANHPGGDD